MTDRTRRNIVKLISASAVTIPATAVIGTLPSHAAALPMVDTKSAQAVALQYVEKSSKANASCKACNFYQGDASGKSGPCPLFQGNHVAADGWCTAYNPRG